MTQAQHDLAVKRIRDAGGKWPPTKMAKATPWRDTGRWQAIGCRGCGQRCDPSRSWCPTCSGVLP